MLTSCLSYGGYVILLSLRLAFVLILLLFVFLVTGHVERQAPTRRAFFSLTLSIPTRPFASNWVRIQSCCHAAQKCNLKCFSVRQASDIQNEERTFKPEMSHQVFGEKYCTEVLDTRMAPDLCSLYCSESVFGYQDLQVNLYYSAARLTTYLGMKYKRQVDPKQFDGAIVSLLFSSTAFNVTHLDFVF